LVEHIEANIRPIEVMVFKIGSNSPNSILTETVRRYTKMWEMACLAGFTPVVKWPSAWWVENR
jgi:hypothetical protein